MSNAPAPIPSERGAKLEEFHGDRNSASRWLAQFRNHLRLNDTRYPTDSERVALFFSCFRGNLGGKWAERRMKEFDADQDDTTILAANKRWTTLASVIAKFKADFAAIDPITVARTAIETLRQEKEFSDIDKFLTEFNSYADDSEFDESSLLYFLKKGLNSSLVDRIALSYPPPATLDDYKARAVEMQHAWENRKAEKNNWRGPGYVPAPRAPAAPRALAADMGVPMDVDASRRPGASSNFPHVPRLTPMDREILRQQGACFKCRRPGHISRNCPTRTTPGTPQSTRNIRATDVATSSPSTDTAAPVTDSTNAIAQISAVANLLRGLQGEDKEQAVACLRDVAGLDF